MSYPTELGEPLPHEHRQTVEGFVVRYRDWSERPAPRVPASIRDRVGEDYVPRRISKASVPAPRPKSLSAQKPIPGPAQQERKVDYARVAELYRSGLTVEQVAQELKASVRTVRRALITVNIPRRGRRHVDENDIVDRYTRQQQSFERICADLRICRKRARSILVLHGVEIRPSAVQRSLKAAVEIDPDWLRHLYVTEGRSINWITKNLRARRDRVVQALTDANIPIRQIDTGRAK